ncbi:hypothetical protein GS399_19130 [Pedobacter sp. HMF7647]|uniref:T9SS C-terminal target domain-containing protein n=1 Tax=Hufsiella arboris TaxID=2695275 RepID=A0A7K1YGE7_9SPHI|nr:hypothetical protein [Hufsiella arboris]MXV53089.1 hypothetical protein [Hufsiella arboris]
MKKHLIKVLLGLSLFSAACSNKNDDEPIPEPPVTGSVVEVSGDIKANTTWTADKIYLLKGFVYVTDGATLTIEAGTLIKGDKASKATLVVTRGAKINATGTADKPIVFTSNQAAGARREGDWGGIILLGKAPVNQAEGVKIEGGLDAKNDPAKYIQYGGSDAADNSGILKYVRIEFGGIPFSVDNEINGLTMGGVGNGTTIDYVEVYRSGDDAFEWFGGTVNCKHLLAIGSWDDDFDTDFGYSGKIQFALAQRYPLVADQSGSNGFESDNDGNGSTLTPQTSAVFSNVSIVGPYADATTKVNGFFQHAAQIRRNSAISAFNSVFAGFPEGIYIDNDTKTAGAETYNNYAAGKLVFQNNLVYGCNAKSNEVKGQSKASFETQIRTENVFNSSSYANALITDPYKYPADIVASTSAMLGSPNFTVKAGTPSETGAAFTNAKLADAFFEKVTYKGAFGTTDWSSGWANYAPQALAYDAPGKIK